jgi:hypothetical protein
MNFWLSSKKLFLLSGAYFVCVFLFNLFFGVTGIVTLDYSLALSVFLLLPLVVGWYSIFGFYKYKIGDDSDPIWVKASISWCSGHVALNLVTILSSITKFDYKIWILFLLVILIYTFWRYEKEETYLYQINSKDLVPIKNFLLEHSSVILFVFLNLGFFLFWYYRMEFVSFNTDSLQNAHLSNILKTEKVFSILAIDLSPQYTQVDYTTIFSPNFALATEFFDFRRVLYVMAWLEIIVSSIFVIVRYNFFRLLGLPKFTSASISFLISVITFSGLYMSGTYYNQQVLVFCLPSILYFLYKRKFWSAFLLFLLLFPFHFTMSVFLAYTAGSFWFFASLEKNKMFSKLLPFFHTGKYLFVFILSAILFTVSTKTFESNYWIVDRLLQLFATRPQYANTIGIYSNVAIIQILIHALGPFLTGLMIAMPFAWIFTNNQLAKWSFFIVSIQIAILSIPFPVAGRTFVFFSLPFGLSVYFLLKQIMVKNWLINLSILVLILSNIGWSVTVRTKDLDITGNYWSSPFLSRSYINFLFVASERIKANNIEPKDYQVISEYFVKHHFESMAYKNNDSGVYQENKLERSLLFEFLNNTRSDACEHYKTKYLVYLLNERVYKWSKVPETLAKNSSFAVWWSKPTTAIESDYIFNFSPKTSGQIIEDKWSDQNRFLLVKCN